MIALLLVAAACVARAQEITADLMAQLRAVDQIDTAVHGDGGDPGPFFKLVHSFETSGSVADFERMATDDDRVVRGMALVCLARAAPERALELARSSLTDATRVTFFPGGCCGSNEPFAVFAREVLRSRNVLMDEGKIDPLVPADEVFALDVDILARDDTWALHDQVARANVAFDPAAADLAKTLEVVTKVQIAKALGRMPPSAARRTALIATSRDSSATREVRLTAASALSRDPHDDAGAALRELELDGSELAAIREAWSVRRRVHDALGPILRPREFEGVEAKPNIDAFDEDHPAACGALLEVLDSSWIRQNDSKYERRIEATLGRMKSRAAAHEAAWNTDSDVAARLAARAGK